MSSREHGIQMWIYEWQKKQAAYHRVGNSSKEYLCKCAIRDLKKLMEGTENGNKS